MIDRRLPSAAFVQGNKIRFWTGARRGEGRIGEIAYDGLYEVGGTLCVYIVGVGAVAISHIEPID